MARAGSEVQMRNGGGGTVRIAALLGILVLFLITAPAGAAPLNETWSATFGGLNMENAYGVVSSADGGYVIAGDARSSSSVVSTDALLIMAGSSGAQLRERKFGGSAYDAAKAVAAVGNDGYIVAGTTLSFAPGGGQDAWLIRTSADGTERWNRSFGSWGTESFSSVIITADGGFAATGVTSSFGNGAGDLYLLKTGPDGTETWHTTFGGAKYDYGSSLAELPDGGFIIAGTTYSLGQSESNLFLLRTDSNGQPVWQKTFGHNRLTFGNDVLALSDGGFAAVGYTDPYPSPGPRSVYVVRTDSAGNMVWEATPGTDRIISEGRSIAHSGDGGFVITGGSLGLYLAGISGDGTTEWQQVIARSPNDWGNAIEPASGSGYIVTGAREQPGNNWDAYLVRVDPVSAPPVVIALPGMANPPSDPDGDGLYEDLNGNGRTDFADVSLFFTYMEWIGENEPVPLFDTNGNGRIDFNDIVKLFEEL